MAPGEGIDNRSVRKGSASLGKIVECYYAQITAEKPIIGCVTNLFTLIVILSEAKNLTREHLFSILLM